MPYEEITYDQYLDKAAMLKPLNLANSTENLVTTGDPQAEKFCDGDKCVL